LLHRKSKSINLLKDSKLRRYMFLSKLFGIFKKNKDPQQQASGTPSSKGSNVVTPGTVTGGAAASSGLSNQNPTSPPSQPVADASGQAPDANNTVSPQGGDTSTPDDTQTVAQADSTTPSYSNEEPAPSAPEESTETTSAPDTDSYQSGSTDGSTEEPKLPPENESPAQPPESGSSASEDDTNSANQDDQSAGGSASIG
jgi:hypothetical protein